MSDLHDLLGLPGRPEHEDFWALSEIVLKHDGTFEDEDASIEDIVGDIVDPESFQYMAMQRAIRVVAQNTGVKLEEGKAIPKSFLRRHQAIILMLASAYYDAFLLGYRYAEKKMENT